MRTSLPPRPVAGAGLPALVALVLTVLVAGPVAGLLGAGPLTADRAAAASPVVPARTKPLAYTGSTPQLRGSGHAGTRLRVTLISAGDFEPRATRLTYVWTRRGEVIPGATDRVYTLTDADRARKVRAIVTGQRQGWKPHRVRSNVVKVVR